METDILGGPGGARRTAGGPPGAHQAAGPASRRAPSHACDTLDRKLLHALDLDARAPFSRIATVLGVSDQTVARRYRRLRATARLRVVAVRDPHLLGQPQWTLRLRCAPEAAEAIAEALARRSDTVWVALASGGTEVTLHVRPRSRGEEQDLLLGRLPRTPRIVEIRAQQVLHRFFGGPSGWTRKTGALSAAQAAALTPPPVVPPGPARITPDEEPLVAALERDGRGTLPELQRATGRTESWVKRRLAALLASGAIYLDVEYDTDALGYQCAFLLSLTTAPSALDGVGRALAGHPEIAYAVATTGPANLMAVAVTTDTASFYHYVSTRLGALEGVQHVETAPFMSRVKQLTYPVPR
ncbi:transcriptional regulator [Streptomyces sulfonofaciens]|uniref:Transcriptional regulator n=1 Tax=Streptomyces sulfonofaciens TaxID=68272 RepID=A0A919GPJ9_9ACTN|nr:Lrp/AsnC ligand binding domain-containing protein [Streptomyces sulfonofaciens]GHH88610.1 transcriptional regulator [Streptomyces sulfonofaciens]